MSNCLCVKSDTVKLKLKFKAKKWLADHILFSDDLDLLPFYQTLITSSVGPTSSVC